MRSDFRTDEHEQTFTEEARRAQIIARAIEVLAEHGYAQLSFAQIAERAHTSKSVISYYFGGKDELLEQVAQSVYSKATEYMKPGIEAERSAWAKLAAFVRSNLEFIRDHAQEVAALTEIVANARTKDGAFRFGASGVPSAALQAILKGGQACGEFGDFDTRTVAWAIRILIDGVIKERALDLEFSFDTCIRELVNLVDRATRNAGS